MFERRKRRICLHFIVDGVVVDRVHLGLLNGIITGFPINCSLPPLLLLTGERRVVRGINHERDIDLVRGSTKPTRFTGHGGSC